VGYAKLRVRSSLCSVNGGILSFLCQHHSWACRQAEEAEVYHEKAFTTLLTIHRLCTILHKVLAVPYCLLHIVQKQFACFVLLKKITVNTCLTL
jgi:hypothetical protein